jgi:hypothetical protein
MSDSTKNTLIGIQKKIQSLKSDSGNSGILQQLLHEAGQLIRLSDKEAGAKIQKYRDELNFYSDGGEDNLERFYRCKAETLTIISKQISA